MEIVDSADVLNCGVPNSRLHRTPVRHELPLLRARETWLCYGDRVLLVLVCLRHGVLRITCPYDQSIFEHTTPPQVLYQSGGGLIHLLCSHRQFFF